MEKRNHWTELMKQRGYWIWLILFYLLLITQYMKIKWKQRLLDNVNGDWQKFPTIFDMKTDIESIWGLGKIN